MRAERDLAWAAWRPAAARAIASRLRCQPLLDRTADLTPARPPVQA